MPRDWARCPLQVRYSSAAAPGEVRTTGTDALAARFDEPTSAMTPGQAIVCYKGDRVIGGGWIDQAQLA